jgi:NAD(P)-dependent dehydrogenase (short-subunit alcohol dehydrogenase family)
VRVKQVRLDGKVAIVTGGATGIGLGIVRALAERGAKLVVNGNYRESGIGPEAEVAQQIRDSGGEAIGVNGAVHHEGTADKIARAAIEAFGAIDILVNNAGVGVRGRGNPLPCPADAAVQEQIDVHCYGAMNMAAAVWPHMKAGGGGAIINVGSIASIGLQPMVPSHGWQAAYPLAKASLFALTRQMAGAGMPDNIKVNLVLPRAVTPLKRRNLAGSKLLEWQADRLQIEPLAHSVVWMAHPDFPLSGQFFSSAGGLVARVAIAESPGYFNPKLTPEDLRDNFDQVTGVVGADGYLSGFYELLDQDTEHQHLVKLYEEYEKTRKLT